MRKPTVAADYLSFENMPNSYESTRLTRVEVRDALLKNAHCARCGYREFSSALCFHHVDPTTKEHGLSALIAQHARCPSCQKLELILAEISKCVILCANCHNALHADQWSLEDNPRYRHLSLPALKSMPVAPEHPEWPQNKLIRQKIVKDADLAPLSLDFGLKVGKRRPFSSLKTKGQQRKLRKTGLD